MLCRLPLNLSSLCDSRMDAMSLNSSSGRSIIRLVPSLDEARLIKGLPWFLVSGWYRLSPSYAIYSCVLEMCCDSPPFIFFMIFSDRQESARALSYALSVAERVPLRPTAELIAGKSIVLS